MAEIKITHERDLVRIAPKDLSVYKGTPLTSLTAYSLYWLHQWQLRRTIEAIAVLNCRLFPNEFSLVGFPQFPDALRTNRSLLQGQPKYRNLLTGAATKGFSLNDRGIDVALELLARLGPPTTFDGEVVGATAPDDSTTRVTNRRRSLDPKSEVKRARESRLFEKWQSGVMSERDLIHVHSLLGIFEHTPTKVRKQRIKDLESNARDLDDVELIKFLADIRRQYPAVFEDRCE